MDWRCVLAAMVLGTLAWSSKADAPHRYEEGEQVPVAHTFHILVKSEAQALSLLSQIQARPAAARFKTFQKLARKHSIDGGSARDGGDLGKCSATSKDAGLAYGAGVSLKFDTRISFNIDYMSYLKKPTFTGKGVTFALGYKF
jgi:hypothetical protein